MHPDYVHYRKEDLKGGGGFFYNFNDWQLNRRYKNIFILVKINVYMFPEAERVMKSHVMYIYLSIYIYIWEDTVNVM